MADSIVNTKKYLNGDSSVNHYVVTFSLNPSIANITGPALDVLVFPTDVADITNLTQVKTQAVLVMTARKAFANSLLISGSTLADLNGTVNIS